MKKCLALIGVTVLSVWTAAAEDVPKVGVFLGYQYVRFSSGNDGSAFSANGGAGQFTYNFNRWLSGVADLGAVVNNNRNGFNIDSTFGNFLFGPRVSFRNHSRITPYVQVLWGGVYATSSTQINGVLADPSIFSVTPANLRPGDAITARVVAAQTAFAMTAGGGVDIRLNRHISFRPIGVDYYLTRISDLRTGGDNNQNNVRYTAGVNFLIGGEKPTPVAAPAPQRTKTCPDGSTVNYDATCPKLNLNLSVNATSKEICQGETTQVMANVPGVASNQLKFAWSVNGQPVSGGPTFQFGGADKAPGTYRVSLAAHGDAFTPASSETTITVREYVPPTGTAAANPEQIHSGEMSALSANFQGQCGGNIQAPTFEASEGTVRGDQFDSTGVQFDPSNNAEQRKTITITAKAADNKSVGTATAHIEVIKAATVAAIRLPDVLFSDKSARVNNCGKRILLDQLRSYVQRDATGTVYLVGHVSSDEPAKLAEQRAMNAAAVITAGSGICLSVPQSQVQLSAPGVDQQGVGFEAGFCQSSVGGASGTASDMRRVVVWFVPTGGQPPASVTNAQTAAALNVGSLGCPK